MFSTPVQSQIAEDFHPFLTDTFNLGIGAFWPNKDYTVRIDGSHPEEEIDFDETFNFDERETTGSLNFRWRFDDKWSVWGQYWGTNSKSGVILEQGIEWGDVVFKAGTFATGGVDTKIARLLFGRTFSTGPQHEFGLGAGVHWLEYGAFIKGQININEFSNEFHRASLRVKCEFCHDELDARAIPWFKQITH